MLGVARNRARKERVQRAFEAFRLELAEWAERREADDTRGQYQSQLKSLRQRLEQVAAAIGAPLAGMDLQRPSADFYEQCKQLELRLNWLQRLWRFFRERFDQRAHPKWGPALKAADEVVWSCYRAVFKEGPTPARAAPLPFLEFEYSPEAFPSELIPAELKSVEATFLRAQLPLLPVALLRLPAACVDEPWWLIHVGHEVGHHVQFALASGPTLVEAFRAHLLAAIEPQADSRESARWAGWTTEIFADVFAVHAMGAPTLSAMVEAELQKDMTSNRPLYPPVAVRLALMAEVANRLGFQGQQALQGLVPTELVKGHERLDKALKLVPQVVDAALASLPLVHKTFSQLCDPSVVQENTLTDWRQKLLAPALPAIPKKLESARQLTGGAFLAWLQLVEQESSNEKVQAFAEQFLKAIQRGAPGGTRAPTAPVSDKEAVESLLQHIHSMNRHELESVRSR